MSPLELLLVVGVAVAALALLLARRSSYASHVSQLGGHPGQQKPKRKLVVGRWTRAEVAAHASRDDLWLILREGGPDGPLKVYDLTDYVDEHPGGEAILDHAGGDASEGFHGPQHPVTVHELVKDYCIGELVD